MGDEPQLHPDLQALVGSSIDERYRVDAILGAGGMGAVFRGHHFGLKRDVAIKVLHPEISMGRDASMAKRFEREAHSASRLDHPNCVRVTDFGSTAEGTKYLVMELLTGGELTDRLQRVWDPKVATTFMRQIFEGLEHAHHVGVVHRDLKPENVFITQDYRGQEIVKLVDFGIAKLLDGEGHEKLTRQGVVFGTPRFMAPEQAAGGKIDERTDLYAAGLIFYELLAGRPPFVSDEAAALLRMQIMAPPPPLADSVPAPLIAVVSRLLEKSKLDRYPNARAVLDAIDAIDAVDAVDAVDAIDGASVSASASVSAPGAAAAMVAAATSATSMLPGSSDPAATKPDMPVANTGGRWEPAASSGVNPGGSGTAAMGQPPQVLSSASASSAVLPGTTSGWQPSPATDLFAGETDPNAETRIDMAAASEISASHGETLPVVTMAAREPDSDDQRAAVLFLPLILGGVLMLAFVLGLAYWFTIGRHAESDGDGLAGQEAEARSGAAGSLTGPSAPLSGGLDTDDGGHGDAGEAKPDPSSASGSGGGSGEGRAPSESDSGGSNNKGSSKKTQPKTPKTPEPDSAPDGSPKSDDSKTNPTGADSEQAEREREQAIKKREEEEARRREAEEQEREDEANGKGKGKADKADKGKKPKKKKKK